MKLTVAFSARSLSACRYQSYKIVVSMDPLLGWIESVERAVADRNPETDYAGRYTAFLDVLGMRRIARGPFGIARSLFDAVEAAIGVYSQSLVDGRPFISNEHVRATVISDSIVLSAQQGDPKALAKLCGFTSYLVHKLIQLPDGPVLLRGGLTKGGLSHDPGLVFGPALVRAYDIERSLQDSMQCIWDPELLDDPQFLTCKAAKGSALVPDPVTGHHMIRIVRDDTRAILSRAAQQILESDPEPKVRAKYEWLEEHIRRAED
jgi:hypothetical protein